MIEKHIDAITKADIDALIENGVREGRTIEYKETLPAGSDEGKREFLGDVSSFANAAGGDLLYGIRAVDGIPQQAFGCTFNPDAEMLRLEGLIRDSVQPRILGVRMAAVAGFPNGPVLLLRVPKSWSGPHMVTFKNLSRFFTRNSAGKYQMDVTEIRAAFLGAEALPEKIRQFRLERIGKIVADETPVRLIPGGRMVLHMLPLASFAGNLHLDIPALDRRTINLRPLGGGGWNSRFNLDGYVNYSSSREPTMWGAYCLLFRSGQVEAVDADLVQEGHRYIASVAYEQDVIDAVVDYSSALKALDIACPLLIMLSMVGVGGACLYVGGRYVSMPQNGIDRDTLLLPEVLVEDYGVVSGREEAAKTLRPAFDAVWNACGFARSFNYDDQGKWNPQR